MSALLLTHLHSHHIADLGDLIITGWITNFGTPKPLVIIGPPGTKTVVEATLVAFGSDIDYRIAHHGDLNAPPDVQVHEHTEAVVWDQDEVTIRVAPTDHRPGEPTITFRVEYDGACAVLAGDGGPCASLDARHRGQERWCTT